MVTVALLLIEKIGEALLPLIANTLAPDPLIVRLPVMVMAPLVRRMVPLTLGENSMVSLPGALLALIIACRNEPRLLLLVLLTVKVAAWAMGRLKNKPNDISNLNDTGGGNCRQKHENFSCQNGDD